MGGRPSKGTPADRRLSENRRQGAKRGIQGQPRTAARRTKRS